MLFQVYYSGTNWNLSGAFFQTEPTETETLHSLTPQVRREKGVAADPPHSPQPAEESGSAGLEEKPLTGRRSPGLQPNT